MPADDVKKVADSVFFDTSQIFINWEHKPSMFISSNTPHYIVHHGFTSDSDLFKVKVENFFSLINLKQEQYSELFGHHSKSLRIKINSIKVDLEQHGAKNLNIQPTSDGSAMFSYTVGDLNYYLEYFINHVKHEMEEAVITAFNGDDMVVDYSGTLNGAINKTALNDIYIQEYLYLNNASGIPADFIA